MSSSFSGGLTLFLLQVGRAASFGSFLRGGRCGVDRQIACLTFPRGAGWTTSGGFKWTFKDKKGPLGDPTAKEQLTLQFNAQTKTFTVKGKVRNASLADPEVGDITTGLFVGAKGFVNTQAWKTKGKKLVTP